MLTKAIVEEVIEKYHARVRIPTINRAENSSTFTPFNELYAASICTPFGVEPCLKKGDVVFVSFEDDMQSSPVILGQLFKNGNSNICNINSGDVTIKTSCYLPDETSIGDIKDKEINCLSGVSSNIQGQLDILSDKSELENKSLEKLSGDVEKVKKDSLEELKRRLGDISIVVCTKSEYDKESHAKKLFFLIGDVTGVYYEDIKIV